MRKGIIYISVTGILGYLFFVSFSLFLPWDVALLRTFYGVLLFLTVFFVSSEVLTVHFLIRKKRSVLFGLMALLLILVVSEIRSRYVGSSPGAIREGWYNVLKEGPLSHHNPDSMVLKRINAGRTPLLIGVLMNSIIVVIATLLKLYQHKAEVEKKNREKLQRSQEAQIIYLKSQVNPHFLFNTLNNLYGLTFSKSDKAPYIVLGLSETMRYLIYETDQKLVPVQKETDFIRNYLELEKMRISNPENVRLSIDLRKEGVFIPPLLLLPFVENCFKHGSIGKREDGWAEIDIWDQKERMFFVCKNSVLSQPSGRESSGIGLKNVKQRLTLIFQDNYHLKINRQEDEFFVSLDFPVFKSRNQL